MHTRPTRPRPTLTQRLLLGLIVSGLSGCAGGEAVTPQALEHARAQWNKAGPRNYDLEWTSTGPRNNRFAVSVRAGRVQSVEGVAPDGRRFPTRAVETKYYSVDGLFQIIADDLAELDQPTPFNLPRGTKAVLRFSPDPQYGYPRSYRRDIMGAPLALAIDVVRFQPLAPEPWSESRNSSADDADDRREKKKRNDSSLK